MMVSLVVGAVAQAQAQTAPTTTSAPTTSTTPATSTTPVQTAQTTPTVTSKTTIAQSGPGFNVSHYPIIDIVPIYTDETLQNSRPGYTMDRADVGGSTKWSFSFDRSVGSTVDTAPERQLNPTTGATTYNANSRDVVLVYRTDWQFSPNWLLEGGLQFRHRAYASCETPPNGTSPAMCGLTAAGTSGDSGISSVPFPYSNSSTEAHWGYLGLTYVSKPIHELFNSWLVLNLTGDDQKMDQNVAVYCTAATTQLKYPGSAAEPCAGHVHQIIYVPEDDLQTNGTPPLNQSNYLETTQSAGINIPFTHGITGNYTYTWGALNFYENQEFPFRWSSAQTYAITDKFNPFVAFTLRWKNFHQDAQDIPYACGTGEKNHAGDIIDGCTNATHVGAFDAFLTFHFDTGKLFH
jgi:hypothetical protein